MFFGSQCISSDLNEWSLNEVQPTVVNPATKHVFSMNWPMTALNYCTS